MHCVSQSSSFEQAPEKGMKEGAFGFRERCLDFNDVSKFTQLIALGKSSTLDKGGGAGGGSVAGEGVGTFAKSTK